MTKKLNHNINVGSSNDHQGKSFISSTKYIWFSLITTHYHNIGTGIDVEVQADILNNKANICLIIQSGYYM